LLLSPPKSEIILGRSDSDIGMTVDVDLSQEGEVAEGVSPRHARVIQESGLHLVEDPGSTYGTKLNGANLEAGELFPLHPGDHLCLDSCILYYAWRSRWSRREMGLSNSLYRC
jgi:pSer/pThr/pTyr-binding forkhead associated (FHA) protein